MAPAPREATPRLRPGRMRVPSMENGAFRVATIRWATASESLQPTSRTTNSSPPRRATVPCGPTHFCSRPRDLHQHLVPGVVAQDVVDFLEVIQVQQQHVHRTGGQQRGGDAFVEEHPVGQSRQRVLEREFLELVRLLGEFLQGAAGLVLGALRVVMSRKFQIRPTITSATFCGREYELHACGRP